MSKRVRRLVRHRDLLKDHLAALVVGVLLWQQALITCGMKVGIPAPGAPRGKKAGLQGMLSSCLCPGIHIAWAWLCCHGCFITF